MKRWWGHSEYVLQVRRRLRAAYRGSLKQALKREREKLDADHRARMLELRMRELEMEREYQRWLRAVSQVKVGASEYKMTRTLHSQVTVAFELLTRAKDANALVGVMADQLGKQVSRSIYELFVNGGRTG